MKHLMLIRHGESEWNRLGRIQGQTDTPLTGLGVEQAQRVALLLQQKLDAGNIRIHSSPMQRARQTASIIAETMAYPVTEIRVDERLNDFHVGDIAGTHGWEKVAVSHPQLAYLRLNDPLSFHPPGGESGTEFRDRLAGFANQSGDDHLIHLVVSHGVVNKFIRAIRRDLSGADIIALGEAQESIFELKGDLETEHVAGSDSTL